ncbi:hypothetical protein BsWGS_11219 [Bradybaena similaris]
MADRLPTRAPDLHVIIIVGLILIILVAVAAVLLFKYVSRLTHNWRQRRAEEVMARAINIYNSQEPLEEPDMVYLRPGDQGVLEPAKDHRGDSEIAFVHSDGRIERFRPLICTNASTRDVPPVRKQYNHRTEARQNSHNATYSNDKEAYTAIQPLCIKLDSVPALCLGTDLGDAISLAGCDVPPSYEEALDMPLAANINTSANTSRRDLGRESRSDYCNINIGQQHSK